MGKVKKRHQEWRQELSAQEYYITRQRGTEQPFTGKYNDFKEEGTFRCVCCGAPLFSSETKYDSGSGWPSFYTPLSEDNVAEEVETGHGMVRTEVKCEKCDAHLGHVFEDGPQPTGLRYCINSAALDFEAAEDY